MMGRLGHNVGQAAGEQLAEALDSFGEGAKRGKRDIDLHGRSVDVAGKQHGGAESWIYTTFGGAR